MAKLAARAEEKEPKAKSKKENAEESDTATEKDAKSGAEPKAGGKAKADEIVETQGGPKEEPKAGGLPIYQMLIAFVFVVIVGGGLLWWMHNRKMDRIKRERSAAARAKREQIAWEKELREVPNPEIEKEEDQLVENLPYAPEGLFYETVDPLAVDDDEGDIADEDWEDETYQRTPAPHHHHKHHHGHHQPPRTQRSAPRGARGSFYQQQSSSRVIPRRY